MKSEAEIIRELSDDIDKITESTEIKECACGCGCSEDKPCQCPPDCSCGCNAVKESIVNEDKGHYSVYVAMDFCTINSCEPVDINSTTGAWDFDSEEEALAFVAEVEQIASSRRFR